MADFEFFKKEFEFKGKHAKMAQVYGKDARYAGAINVITTLLCMITMPIMVYLYQL